MKINCNGCTLCCQHDTIFLMPEYGDDISGLETEPAVNPITGKDGFKLKRRKDGSCYYLERGHGCMIYDRRPVICAKFDCGKWYELMRASGASIRNLVGGQAIDAVLKKGREIYLERQRAASKPGGFDSTPDSS